MSRPATSTGNTVAGASRPCLRRCNSSVCVNNNVRKIVPPPCPAAPPVLSSFRVVVRMSVSAVPERCQTNLAYGL